MAVVPISGTNIRIFSGVPFHNDYKNTRWFDTESQQLSYFNNRPLVHSIHEATFQRMTGETYIVCNESIDKLMSANYVMFQNKSYNSKWFYGFITRLEYIQRGTTHIYFEIDLIQTWRFQFNFKPSYVIREHCKQFESNGLPVINTIDEGLDYGTDYDVVDVRDYKATNKVYYLVLVSKSLLHNESSSLRADPPAPEPETNEIRASINAVPQPLCYYIHPFKLDGGNVNVTIGGSSMNLTNVVDLLSNIYSQDDAVNNIVSLYITEHMGYNPVFSGANSMNFSANYFSKAMIADGASMNIDTIYVKHLPEYNNMEVDCGNIYANFRPVKESKLKMYPYQVTILTDFKGNQFEIKNEYVTDGELKVLVRGSLGVSNKVAYTLPYYQTSHLGTLEDLRIVGLDSAIINNNPQDVPIITDMLSAYLQGNRNSLENQKNSIMWNGLTSALGGAASGIAQGGVTPTGVASAGANVVAGAGNTVLQLQGLQAKKQDIANTPPQLVKMGGNTAFDFGHDYSGFYIIKKQIKQEYIDKLESFFKMFGYKVNQVKTPNFHTRRSWNYVQTSSCFITGNFNNEDLTGLQKIFDDGITLWHNDDVGNYGLTNEVI